MIRLSAVNASMCYFLSKEKLEDITKFILKSEGLNNASLSIIFTTDKEIKRLNYLYRRRNRFTDVLSFSMRNGKRIKRDSWILGDIAISVDRARIQAKRFNSTFKKEIYLYIIHGLLHLLGYDDRSPSSRKMMQKRETQILSKVLCRF